MKKTVEEKRFKELERAEAKLRALEAGGVDNWDWYSESLKDYNATIQREEDMENLLSDLLEVLCAGAYEPSERGAGFTVNETAQAEALQMLMKRVKELNDE